MRQSIYHHRVSNAWQSTMPMRLLCDGRCVGMIPKFWLVWVCMRVYRGIEIVKGTMTSDMCSFLKTSIYALQHNP